MLDMIERVIDELSYGDVAAKQRSITSLFPTFHDRVKKVANAGAATLDDVDEEKWTFKVHSSDKNLWYHDVVKFKDVDEVIYNACMNKKLWKRDGSGIDYRLVGTEVLYNCDLELYCSCPAFLYWGSAYILTKRIAKYTEPEDRRPRIRNPKEYGAMCKHLQLVFNVLPFYSSTMSKYIKAYFEHVVELAEGDVRERDEELKKSTELLKKKEKDRQKRKPEEKESGEEEKPKPEQGTENSQKEGEENA